MQQAHFPLLQQSALHVDLQHEAPALWAAHFPLAQHPLAAQAAQPLALSLQQAFSLQQPLVLQAVHFPSLQQFTLAQAAQAPFVLHSVPQQQAAALAGLACGAARVGALAANQKLASAPRNTALVIRDI